MEPCSQEQRIARMEAAIEGIGEKVDGLASDVRLLTEELKNVLISVAEHDRALKGNNGTIGLIAKVAGALEVLSDLQEALRGRGEKPGLIAKIDQLNHTMEDWQEARKWLTRLVVGWLVTTALGVILLILK